MKLPLSDLCFCPTATVSRVCVNDVCFEAFLAGLVVTGNYCTAGLGVLGLAFLEMENDTN